MYNNSVELHSLDGIIEIKKSRTKCCLQIMLVGCIVLIISSILIGASFGLGYLTGEKISNRQEKYVYYDYNEIYPDRSDINQKNILNTREFQITLQKSHYEDRMATIEDMIEKLRTLSGEDISIDDFNAEVYIERQYDCKVCGHQYSELRRRIHYYTNGTVKEDETNIDINEDITDKKEAFKWNLAPSEAYSSNCEQKLEEDIHTSHYKYCIKSKIKNLPTDFSFNTCKDVVDLFPYSFDEDYDKSGEITPSGSDKVVWIFWYQNKMFNESVKVKFDWTLIYDDLESALDFTKPPTNKSEFSIRIYSPGEGKAPHYRESLEWIASVYRGMVSLMN